jgi:hypothetical protein
VLALQSANADITLLPLQQPQASSSNPQHLNSESAQLLHILQSQLQKPSSNRKRLEQFLFGLDQIANTKVTLAQVEKFKKRSSGDWQPTQQFVRPYREQFISTIGTIVSRARPLDTLGFSEEVEIVCSEETTKEILVSLIKMLQADPDIERTLSLLNEDQRGIIVSRLLQAFNSETGMIWSRDMDESKPKVRPELKCLREAIQWIQKLLPLKIEPKE